MYFRIPRFSRWRYPQANREGASKFNSQLTSRHTYLNPPQARKYIRSLPHYKPRPFRFPKGDEQALDLMYQMLRYEPEKRATAASALEHPWLAAFYDPEDDYFAPQPVVFDRWREIESMQTVDEFRDAIWNEIKVGVTSSLLVYRGWHMNRTIERRLDQLQRVPCLQSFRSVNQGLWSESLSLKKKR